MHSLMNYDKANSLATNSNKIKLGQPPVPITGSPFFLILPIPSDPSPDFYGSGPLDQRIHPHLGT